MIQEQKVLKYKGKIVFEKMTISNFKRMPKLFQENEACFMFINQGEFLVRTPTEVLTFDTETALLAKCFNYFFETTEEQRQQHEYLEVIGVVIHASIVEEIFRFDLSTSDFTVDFDAKRVNVDTLLLIYKASINFLLDNPSIADDALILTKLKEFILMLSKVQNMPSELDFLSAMFTSLDYDFKTTIEHNVYSSLKLEEFAKLCNMSDSTFKRKFKSVYNQSFGQYIIQRKLEKATLLLAIEQHKIIDIALDCGFESISSFNRNFKKHKGISPSLFRKQLLE